MDIRKAIEKLNSIDAKDLKKIDLSKLKDFDISRFKEDLITKPKLLINSLFILGALGAVIFSFSNYQNQGKTINTQLTEMQQKLEIIEQSKTVEMKYNQFFAGFPRSVSSDAMIGKISEFAEKSRVNIVSFVPLRTQENEYVIQHVINLFIEVKSYQDLVDFCNAVENSNFALRIDKWAIVSKRTNLLKKGETEIPLEIQMEISSLQLKDV